MDKVFLILMGGLFLFFADADEPTKNNVVRKVKKVSEEIAEEKNVIEPLKVSDDEISSEQKPEEKAA